MGRCAGSCTLCCSLCCVRRVINYLNALVTFAKGATLQHQRCPTHRHQPCPTHELSGSLQPTWTRGVCFCAPLVGARRRQAAGENKNSLAGRHTHQHDQNIAPQKKTSRMAAACSSCLLLLVAPCSSSSSLYFSNTQGQQHSSPTGPAF